ncbi:hypothetical protein DB29_00700 [Shouchella clausii]|nr:hypothetical protein DB29_00700 [Shouchella clausii]
MDHVGQLYASFDCRKLDVLDYLLIVAYVIPLLIIKLYQYVIVGK